MLAAAGAGAGAGAAAPVLDVPDRNRFFKEPYERVFEAAAELGFGWPEPDTAAELRLAAAPPPVNVVIIPAVPALFGRSAPPPPATPPEEAEFIQDELPAAAGAFSRCSKYGCADLC